LIYKYKDTIASAIETAIKLIEIIKKTIKEKDPQLSFDF